MTTDLFSASDADAPMVRGEAAAWNRAERMSEAEPNTLFEVWKVPGGFAVLRAGEMKPAHGECWGSVRTPSAPARTYTIQTVRRDN